MLRWVDIRLKGVQHILPRIEAMALRHAVELRHPFFESEMMALSFSLPARLKLDGAREKALLKRIARGRGPDAVVERRKAGMGVPTPAWFRGALRPLTWRWLSRRRLSRSGLLAPEGVHAVLSGNLGPRDCRSRRWGDRLWMLCILEAWFESVRREG